MTISRFFLIAMACLVIAVPAADADLEKTDRTIAKEPVYQTKSPRYCLLVFGSEAKTRVWLALDGDVLYVDRNGNGDLAEKGERFAGDKRPDGIHWLIGDIVEANGKNRHTGLKVRSGRGGFLLFLRTADNVRQEVGNEFGQLRFSDIAQDAPIVHLAGPLTFLLSRPLELIPGEEAHFIALIGTPGQGVGTETYSHHEDFPQLNMVVKGEFSRGAAEPPLRVDGLQTEF